MAAGTYQPIRDSDASFSDIEEDADKTGLLEGTQKTHGNLPLRQRIYTALQPRRPSFTTVAIGIVLLITNLFTYNIAKHMPSSTSKEEGYISRVGEPPKVARVFKELDLTETHSWKFDSTFHNYGSPYRGPPGPETDAVWENEGGAAFGNIWIPLDEAEEAGITPDHMHFDGTQEGIPAGYPVHVEVFHQIHCLNLIRMSTWYNSEYYRPRKQLAFSHPEEQVIEHVDHCIDNIRQRLMCTADVGLIPFYWVNETGRIGTDPDFQQAHTCRDFKKLHAWMKEHSMEFPNVTIMPRPGDFQKSGFT
ncbi:protein of unknown function (DUF3328) domain containing protein [Naviculisporaceae sp. PSN 640]